MVEKYWRHISLKLHEEKLQQFYHSLIIFHHYLKYAVFLRITHSKICWNLRANETITDQSTPNICFEFVLKTSRNHSMWIFFRPEVVIMNVSEAVSSELTFICIQNKSIQVTVFDDPLGKFYSASIIFEQ